MLTHDQALHGDNPFAEEYPALKISCGSCCGLCCTALYFFQSDGFPKDKQAGEPCQYLKGDYRCGIHPQLRQRGFKGCMAYDCFGAGQQARKLFQGKDWRTAPDILEVFLALIRLHQTRWYLLETASLIPAQLRNDAGKLIKENKRIAGKSPEGILTADVGTHQEQAKQLLRQAALLAARAVPGNRKGFPKDLIGKKYKGQDLSGADFSKGLLIAADMEGCLFRGANLIGADMRDTNIRGSDLRDCIYLTQGQLNTAAGSAATKLPRHLQMPPGWVAGKA